MSSGLGDSSSLASGLTPALVQACEGRLSNVEWFRSSWQAGGASTAFAVFRDGDGLERPCLVKVPLGPAEYRWTTGLGSADDARRPTPKVYASGMELPGVDLAWVVLERIQGPPLTQGMDRTGIEDLLATAVEWYARAATLRPIGEAGPPKREDWAGLIGRAREACKGQGMAEGQRWNEALKQVQKALPHLVERWEARPINTWCHGDLHPGNALRRGPAGSPDHACVLIDLALVHPGHWVEDAVYLERLFWGKPELLGGVKPVSTVARHLRERGLSGPEDATTLANIRRLLMAATAPAFLAHEGHPRHVHAALEQVEKLLPMVGR